ncbi:MAG: T9SS type A sorting domain-containing protein, partial [Bacteroidota bacterium]
VQFVHLAAGSDLINAGTDVGIPFIGSAPDLGAFEFGNVSGVVPSHRTAASFALEQNFPNPFNPSTTITYRMPAKGRVVMRVFDILGTEITTLVDGVRDAGEYHVQFDGSTLSSGIYFYQVQTDAALQTKKMMLLK